MTASQRQWRLLAEHIVLRRLQLGYHTAQDFARAAGISRPIISDLETGDRHSYSIQTIVKLQEALHWETGSVESVLAGGRPVEKPVNQTA